MVSSFCLLLQPFFSIHGKTFRIPIIPIPCQKKFSAPAQLLSFDCSCACFARIDQLLTVCNVAVLHELHWGPEIFFPLRPVTLKNPSPSLTIEN